MYRYGVPGSTSTGVLSLQVKSHYISYYQQGYASMTLQYWWPKFSND